MFLPEHALLEHCSVGPAGKGLVAGLAGKGLSVVSVSGFPRFASMAVLNPTRKAA